MIELIAKEVGISGFLDIAFMSLLIYSILVWFKRTRAAFVVIGMFIIGVAYLLARQLDLSLTTIVFQGFFAIILIAVVVIFQEEIKHFFEQVASRSLARNLKTRKLLRVPRREIETLVRVTSSFARDHIGALIVIRGRDPIVRHLEGGEDLNGEISEAILHSIFDPHSVGHDGAVIIKGNVVTQFGCHLPLSKDLQRVGRSGTRHAAALGLAELTDAFCLVVSEELGTISVAQNGEIREVRDPEELSLQLEAFYGGIIPQEQAKPWKDFFRKNYREKAIAVTVTIALWFLFVHEAKLDYRTFRVPVDYNNLPPNMVVAEIDPSEVEVTVSGSRRAFYFFNQNEIRLSLKLFDAREVRWKKTLSKSNVFLPEGISPESIQPQEVTLHIEEGTP